MIKNFKSIHSVVGEFTGIEGQSGKNICQGGISLTLVSYTHLNVCGSTYENGCVVNGMCAMAAD